MQKDTLPFLDLCLCFSCQVLASHSWLLCHCPAAVSAAALEAPRSKLPDQSARFQSVRNSFERLSLEIHCDDQSSHIPSARRSRDISDTHGCTRHKPRSAAGSSAGTDGHFSPADSAECQGGRGACAWCSRGQSVPVPRSAATRSADLPIAGSSRLKLSNNTHPACVFKIKSSTG